MSNTNRRPVRSLPLPARRWRLKVAGLAETRRLTKLALVAGVLAGVLGCNGTVPPPAPEVVGQLAASADHVYRAPVHADTDFGHAQIVETGDDTGEVATTVTRTDDAGVDGAELPEVTPKSDGVVTGAVRQ
jgi:hypothetical protein